MAFRRNGYRRRRPRRRKAPGAFRRSSYRRGPARFRGRKTFSRTNKVVKTVLKSISENKFHGYNQTDIGPVQAPAGTQPVSYHFINTGESIQAANAEFQLPMDMFVFKKGTEPTERIGQSMYIRKTSIKLEINMTPKLVLVSLIPPHASAL